MVKKTIPVNFLSVDEKYCNINIEIPDKNIIDLEDSFEIIFRNSLVSKNFSYICGSIKLPRTKKISCYYETGKFTLLDKGIYEFDSLSSLGDNNDFLYTNFYKQSFEFYGYDDKIMNYKSNYYYISGENSKIVLKYIPQFKTIFQKIPNIYPNLNIDIKLSDCDYIKYSKNDYLINCNIKNNELEYFKYYEKEIIEEPILYSKFCGK